VRSSEDEKKAVRWKLADTRIRMYLIKVRVVK